MKYLLILLLLLATEAFAQTQAHEYPQDYATFFKEAYQQNPTVPKGILEAVAYTNTRMHHLVPETMQPSCMDMPRAYGVMGLITDGKGYFRNNLQTISALSGIDGAQIRQSARLSILAYSAAFTKLQQQNGIGTLPDNLSVLIALSELPYQADTYRSDFALNSFLYSVLHFLNDPEFRTQYGISTAPMDIREALGDDLYRLVSAPFFDMSREIPDMNIQKMPDTPPSLINAGALMSINCNMPTGPAEYAAALWNSANSANYSSYAITPYTVAVHTVQGSYAGCISWFQNPSASVSAHYVVRSFDGQVTQMVCHRNRAWHVGTQNSFSVGIEHEGYIEQGITWYTNALYQSSALLSRFIAEDMGINKLQTYDGPPTDGLLPLSHTCHKIKGHQHYIENTHTDPGPQWNWYRYYQLINDLPTPTTYTSPSGTVYDSGGSSGNYANEERTTYLIQPPGAASITLTFSAYSIEDGWDYLWIYDGNSPNGALIGKYSGTSPGTVTAYSGAIYMEFHSDCSTTALGWAAGYTTTTTPLPCPPPNGLSAIPYAMNANLTWNAVAGASGYEVSIKRDLDNTWTTYLTTNLSLPVSGLIAGSVYQWRVRTQCSSSFSGYAGHVFVSSDIGTTTTSAGSYVNTNCEGLFYDSGGTAAHYAHNENWTYTIAPVGAATVTLTFTQFDTEANYDFLRIYDGPSVAAPLIGTYSGTTSPGTVTSSGGTLTIRFTSDGSTYNSGWAAAWVCTLNCSLTTQVNAPATNWQTDDFTATFTDINNCGNPIQDRFYQALAYNNNEWRGNPSAGQLNDEFNQTVMHPDWTPAVGSWSMNTGNGSIQQTDEANGNSKAYAALTQTSGNTWLYHWRARIEGSGNNRRSGIHFFGSDANGVNLGNSYFVYFRTDNDKAQIYRVTGDTWTLQTDSDIALDPNVWYDFKITYSPGTGVINAYLNNALVSTWTDPSPLTSGSFVSLRTGNCITLYDFIRVYRSRTGTTASIGVGSSPSDAFNQQNPNPAQSAGKITSLLRDNNGWSAEANTLVNIDWTAPSTVTVNDGIGADIDITGNANQLSANWTTATDVHSGIQAYQYGIGSTPGTANIINWTDNGMTTAFTQSGLTLNDGQTYYISVRAYNGAGLFSTSVSDGITVVLPCPIPQNLTLSDPSTTAVQANWQSVGNALQYNLRYKPIASGIWSSQIIPANTTTAMLNSLNPCTVYEIQVQSICAGQSGEFSTSQVFTTGNPLAPVINGTPNVCGSEIQTYTATLYPNVTYNWMITGGVILNGQGTHEITVQWNGVEAGELNLVVEE